MLKKDQDLFFCSPSMQLVPDREEAPNKRFLNDILKQYFCPLWKNVHLYSFTYKFKKSI